MSGMLKAYNRDGGRSISCPKCNTQILEPEADVYKCPNCSTFSLAKGSGRLDSGLPKHHKSRKHGEGRPRSSGGSFTPEKAKLIYPPTGSLNPSNSTGDLLRPKESSDIEERSYPATFSDSETSSSGISFSEVASPNGVLEVMSSSSIRKWEQSKGSAKSLHGVNGPGSTHRYESLGVVADDKMHWLSVLNSQSRMSSESSNVIDHHNDFKPHQNKEAIRYREASDSEAIQPMQHQIFDLKILGITEANGQSGVRPEKVMKNSGIQETKSGNDNLLHRREFSTHSVELVGMDTGLALVPSTMMMTALPDTVSSDNLPHQTHADVIDSLAVEPDLEFLLDASGYNALGAVDWMDSVHSSGQLSSSSGKSTPLSWNGQKGSGSQNSSRNLTSMEQRHSSSDLQKDQLKQESANGRSVRSRRRSTSSNSDFRGSNPLVETGSHYAHLKSSAVATRNAQSHDMVIPVVRNSHSYHGMEEGNAGHYNLQTPEASSAVPTDYMELNASSHCVMCVHERYHVQQQTQISSNISPQLCVSCTYEQTNSHVHQSSSYRTQHSTQYTSGVNDNASAIPRKQKIYPPLPGKGAAPYVVCKHCDQLVKVPGYLHPVAGSFQRLKCGECGKASRFYVVDGVLRPFDSPVYILQDDESEVNSSIQLEQGPSFEGSHHSSKSLQRSENSIPAGAPLIEHLSRSINGMTIDSYRRQILFGSLNIGSG